MSNTATKMKKMATDEFVIACIKAGRNGKSKGIHTVYSGFNDAFRKYYEADPVEATQKLAEEGKILMHRTKGGAMVYLPGEGPKVSRSNKAADELLAAILN